MRLHHLIRRAALCVVALTAATTITSTAATASAAPGSSIPDVSALSWTLKPLTTLDVGKYLGTWWQLATIPAFYGVRCAKDTNATYGLINATTISVDNKCISFTGQPDGITGKATVVGNNPAALAVTFPGIPATIDLGSFPNYQVAWVADGTDGKYKYAIVGDPFRLSGFLLSRDKGVPTPELLALRSEIEKLGFNSCTFLVSPITGWRSDYSPLCTVTS